MESVDNHDDKLSSLLEEFSKTRDAIYEMIAEVETISKNVKQMFPTSDKFDNRYRMVFQERVKATSEIFKTLLDMRKEITKSIKDEIELRRKVKSGETKFDDIEELINVSSLVDKIEKMQNKAEAKSEKIIKIPKEA